MTPEDVEALFQKELPSVGEALTQDRTELLRGVCGTLREKRGAKEQGLESYIEKLANGSRDGEWHVAGSLHSRPRRRKSLTWNRIMEGPPRGFRPP